MGALIFSFYAHFAVGAQDFVLPPFFVRLRLNATAPFFMLFRLLLYRHSEDFRQKTAQNLGRANYYYFHI